MCMQPLNNNPLMVIPTENYIYCEYRYKDVQDSIFKNTKTWQQPKHPKMEKQFIKLWHNNVCY